MPVAAPNRQALVPLHHAHHQPVRGRHLGHADQLRLTPPRPRAGLARGRVTRAPQLQGLGQAGLIHRQIQNTRGIGVRYHHPARCHHHQLGAVLRRYRQRYGQQALRLQAQHPGNGTLHVAILVAQRHPQRNAGAAVRTFERLGHLGLAVYHHTAYQVALCRLYFGRGIAVGSKIEPKYLAIARKYQAVKVAGGKRALVQHPFQRGLCIQRPRRCSLGHRAQYFLALVYFAGNQLGQQLCFIRLLRRHLVDRGILVGPYDQPG